MIEYALKSEVCMKSIIKKEYIIFIVASLMILIIYLNYDSLYKISFEEDQVNNGIIDLKEKQNIKEYLLKLDGFWQFQGNSENIKKESQLMFVPMSYKQKDGSLTGGTYALEIRNLKQTVYGLKLDDLYTSFELYVDDKLIASEGVVSSDSTVQKGKVTSKVVYFYAKNPNLKIRIEVSDGTYYKGGILNSIVFGPMETVIKYHQHKLLKDGFIAGTLLIMAFYHILMYLYKTKEKENLYFGVFSILVFFETIFQGQKLFSNYFPSISFAIEERFQFLEVILMVIFYIAYIHSFFKLEVKKQQKAHLIGFSTFFIILNFILPFRYYPILWKIYEGVILLSIVYIAYLLISQIRKRVDHAWLVTIGFLCIGIATIHDILLDLGLVCSFALLPVAFIIFLFIQMMTVSMKYAKFYSEIETLTIDLAQKNQKLNELNKHMETKVTERTLDLEVSEKRYRHLVDATFEGLIIVNGTTIIDVNEAFSRYTGYRREDLVGENVMNFFPLEAQDVLNHAKEEQREKTYIIDIQTKNKENRTVEVVSRSFDYYGQQVKIGAIRDITDRIINEKKLEKVQESLKQAQEIAQMGSYEYDFQTGEMTLSEALMKLINFDASSSLGTGVDTFKEMIKLVLAEDEQQRAIEMYYRVMIEKKDGRMLVKTKPIRGKMKWFRIDSKYVIDRIDGHEKLMGVVLDVTEQKEQEFALQYNLNFLNVLIDTIPNPIFYKDKYGQYIGCNESFASYFNTTKEAVVQTKVSELIQGEAGKFYRQKDLELLRMGGRQIYETELMDGYGTNHSVIFSKATFYNLAGEVEGIVGVIIDVSDYKRIQDELKKTALTDELTGLYNRKKFNEVLKEEVKRSKREETHISLIMFDIDYFKQVNDNYGHLVGDEILKTVAHLVNYSTRETDVVARWGGEEFMVLLRATNIYGATILAEKLRKTIEHANFESVGKVTCSFGVCEHQVAENEEAFLKRVDEALYRAKENGRNRVEI